MVVRSISDPTLDAEGPVIKAIVFDNDGVAKREFVSKQLTEDPFMNAGGTYGYGLTVPPYSLEQLALLAESHPIHSAAIEQKVADIVASGPIVVPRTEDQTDSDKKGKAAFQQWIEDLTEDTTTIETLYAEHNDFETMGIGYIEGAYDEDGLLQRIWHVPSHTVRVHRSNRKFAQIRQGRMVWFKLWGEEGELVASSGMFAGKDLKDALRTYDLQSIANVLVPFKKPSRRSSWYGIPVYVSALGFITLALAARDFNIFFFENAREPRHVFILTGMNQQAMQVAVEFLETHLKTQHKQPHRNLVFPVIGGAEAKVTIERLALPQNDMHFTKLLERADEEILIGHRMPADRLGIARRGFLGGSVANVVNRIYKDGVVARGQDMLEDRLGRFLMVEYAKHVNMDYDKLPWKVDLEQLDVTDEVEDTTIVVQQVKLNIITMNEGRIKLGREPREDFDEYTLAEWMKEKGLAGGGGGGEPMSEPEIAAKGVDPQSPWTLTRDFTYMQEQLLKRFDDIDGFLEEALTGDADNAGLADWIADG